MKTQINSMVVIICMIAATLFIVTDSFAASKKSKKNQKNAEAYCAQLKEKGIPCKVAKTIGCGPGWKKAKKFKNGGNAWYACKPRCPEWKINVDFTIGAKECETWSSKECKNIIKWLKNEIQHTESIYSTPPGIKVAPKFTWIGLKKGGKNLDKLNFKDDKEYQRYMDKHFDHRRDCEKKYKLGKRKGKCKKYYLTRGTYRFLVTDDLIIAGNDKIGGISHFPLFYRRHAPILVVPHDLDKKLTSCPNNYTGVMAHELGHVFNLEHTFERDICNGDYKKNMGSSLRKDNSINLMDYKADYEVKKGTDVWWCYRTRYLNNCQRRKAAFERTIHSHQCRVAYGFLKGVR